MPKTMITYKRPATLSSYLTNYRTIAHGELLNDGSGFSTPCGHCALCGNFGRYKIPMVKHTTVLRTPTNILKLRQRLTCSDYGVYVATCILCKQQYVGQTVTKFSTR